ncbi:MAG: hypothetical protein Q7S09_05350 [bacterium]|nr:hypothetical protein [bacterium]
MPTNKQKLLIIASLLVGLAGGGLMSLFQEPYTEASRSFLVQNKRYAAQNAYDYEGYYALQTANESAKALSSWLTSPGGVYAVYRDAGMNASFKTLRSYERAFSVRGVDTPFFEIRYHAAIEENAEKLSVSLERVLKQQLASFQGSDSLSLASSPLVLVDRQIPLVRNLFYGALFAGALALFGILFDKAMKGGS